MKPSTAATTARAGSNSTVSLFYARAAQHDSDRVVLPWRTQLDPARGEGLAERGITLRDCVM